MHKYELIVLGFLLERPMYGYQINKEVKLHRMDSWVNINIPVIYITLAKLEKNGMIKNDRVEREGLMPERKIFRLTSKGKERLANLVRSSLLDKNLTYDLSSLGYFFIFALPKDKALDCLNQKKALLERSIQSLTKRLSDFRGKTPVVRYLVIQKDIDRFKSELLHLKKMIKRVDMSPDWREEAFV